LVGQVAQALVQDVAGDAQVLLELVEAGDPQEGVAQVTLGLAPPRAAAVYGRCRHGADTAPPVSGAEWSCTGLPVTGPAPHAAMVMDGQGLTSEHRRQG
jgi:hypothetical protein